MQNEKDSDQTLEQEMIELSAREQIRQAKDLHDGLREYFSGLAFHARALADELHRAESSHASHAERIVAILRTTNQISRQVNRALQGAEIEAGGLADAVRSLATEFEQGTGVRCEIVSNQRLPAIDAFRTSMLVRIVRDAVNNTIKHARPPRTIRVLLSFADECLTVSVISDGQVGTATAVDESRVRHTLMKLRAELIGARLEAGPASAGSYQVQCFLRMSNSAFAADANASFAW